MDVWILCKNEGGVLTPIGIGPTEARARDIAADGDFTVIPIHFGREYDNLIDLGIVGTVTFSSTSLKTLVQQAKDAIQEINGRLDTLESQMDTVISQGQTMQQAIDDLDARVTALENP